MAVVVKELRDALIAAGAPPEKAEAAAEAVLPAGSAATKDEVRMAVAELKTWMSEQIVAMTWRLAALLIAQAVGIVGLTVTLVKLLP